MKDFSKKEKSILLIVFISVLIVSTLSFYSIINYKPTQKEDNKTEKLTSSEALKVGKYSLKYGTYKGTETEYNQDTGKTEKKTKKITLTKDKINNESYEIKGTSLYINGYEMYKVTANNKIELLAGEGVEFVYEGK